MDDREPSSDALTEEQVETPNSRVCSTKGCPVAFGKLVVHASQSYLRSVACVGHSLNSLQAKLAVRRIWCKYYGWQQALQRDFPSFQGEQFEELLAWMRQILVHNLSNYKRHFEQTAKRSISREICGEQAAHAIENLDRNTLTPSSQLASLEQLHTVQDVLSRLPDEMKAVIELRNKEGLSFSEIGERLRCSSAAARRMWARAIERMQHLLPNHHDHA